MHLRYFIAFLILAAFTMYLSSVPSLGASIPNEILNQVIRKTGHVVLFAGLAYLLWESLPRIEFWLRAVLCLLLLLGFAAVSEGYQMFVPGRQGNLVGFSFDVLGVVLMLGYLLLVRLRKGRV